jgi:hypothetical protein
MRDELRRKIADLIRQSRPFSFAPRRLYDAQGFYLDGEFCPACAEAIHVRRPELSIEAMDGEEVVGRAHWCGEYDEDGCGAALMGVANPDMLEELEQALDERAPLPEDGDVFWQECAMVLDAIDSDSDTAFNLRAWTYLEKVLGDAADPSLLFANLYFHGEMPRERAIELGVDVEAVDASRAESEAIIDDIMGEWAAEVPGE